MLCVQVVAPRYSNYAELGKQVYAEFTMWLDRLPTAFFSGYDNVVQDLVEICEG